jgi:hypothetical protein
VIGRRVTEGILGCCFLLAQLVGPAAAIAVPAGLLGKSVIISFSTNWVVTLDGDSHTTHLNASHQISVYMSRAGRAFSKVSSVARGFRGLTSYGRDTERAPGDKNANVHFEGGTLLVDFKLGSGARRIVVTFDDRYSGCSARVLHGKEKGTPMRNVNLAGRPQTIHSIEAVSPSCSIKDGNVFATQ